MSDSNSETSPQIISLKGRTDLQESSRILATETFAFLDAAMGIRSSGAGAQPMHHRRQLPHNGQEFQYRIKSANEQHERVARESELTKA